METQSELITQLVGFLLLRKYDAGERIPSERDLAVRFKVGRGNIRETLSYLEALRIIERRAKSGIFMSGDGASIEALAFYAQLGLPLNADDVHDSIEIRRIHEIAAIELACERATDENFAALREILKRTEVKIKRREPINEEDRDFHLEIVSATQNKVFYQIVKLFYLMTEKRRLAYFQNPQRCRASYADHLKICAALTARNRSKVVDLMQAHLKGADRYWQDLIVASAATTRVSGKSKPLPVPLAKERMRRH
jgi:DNA-binding FadR family transcriptional regulator